MTTDTYLPCLGFSGPQVPGERKRRHSFKNGKEIFYGSHGLCLAPDSGPL